MLTEDRDGFKHQNWLILITPHFPVFELCWHSQELGGADFVSKIFNLQKKMFKDTSMEIMIWLSWLPSPTVMWENSLEDKLPPHPWKSLRPLPRVGMAPAVCSACGMRVFPVRNSPLLSEALPVLCLSQPRSRCGVLFFCSCVWPDGPPGSLSQAPSIMPNGVWATMLCFGLGEGNGECC